MNKPALVALATLVTLGVVPMGSARADDPSDEAAFVARINALRATRGAPALEVHPNLTAKARSWAGTMAGRNSISHSSLADGITVNWQKLGENVGMGHSVDSLTTAFVNSPSHYNNLVDPAFRSVGIGVVRNAAGVMFVAEEFMLARAPAAGAATKAPAAAKKAVKKVVKKKVVKKKAVRKVVKKKALRVKTKARRVAPRATRR